MCPNLNVSSDAMESADSFLMLMDRLRASDHTAAGDLFQRFAARLMGIARVQIATRLRHKVEPEDVVQSVFKSFFLRTDQLQLESWDSLWGLLTLITVQVHQTYRARAGRPPGCTARSFADHQEQ